MNFNEKELFSVALVGFDLINGPFLKWKKKYDEINDFVNLDDFAVNFYLSFRGGNAGKKPRAILYDDFYVVAFPKDLELCCLFMKPRGIETNIKNLNKIASRIMVEMESDDDEDVEGVSKSSDVDTVEEVKRLITNILNDTEMSTPELRKYFKLTNSEIWKLISDLESDRKIKRTGKKGRAQLWTAI
ncbi:MAG: hypothetical protein KGD63_11205 [Candidatus Lokiarchaeota archaeon]|nr:hypothetical protein [Candidatus Lokiarchaeota archaeon]